MIHRMRLIKLKDGLPNDTVRKFVQVLNESADHIPAVRSSSTFDDVDYRKEWSHAHLLQFDQVQDIKAYIDSEYHLKVIVPYFRDSPQKIVERTTVIAWDDSAKSCY